MSSLANAGAHGNDTRFVVTVGTDHHPFDRLIRWVNDWLELHPEQIQTFMVQWGSASVQPVCAGEAFLEVDRLDEFLDSADVMICHGGPGSIADAWARGQVPIAVPRLRRLGEVVDDHQVDFCRKLASLGRVRLAEDPGALAGLLDEALRDRVPFSLQAPPADVDATVARFEALVAELVSLPHRRRLRFGRRRMSPGAIASVDDLADFDDSRAGPSLTVNGHQRGSRPPADIGRPEMANKEQG